MHEKTELQYPKLDGLSFSMMRSQKRGRDGCQENLQEGRQQVRPDQLRIQKTAQLRGKKFWTTLIGFLMNRDKAPGHDDLINSRQSIHSHSSTTSCPFFKISAAFPLVLGN